MNARHRSPPVRIGFLPLADAAPLGAAQARGLFAQQGLEAELRREVGWATVRDKLIAGELEAAAAPAPLLWGARLAREAPPCPMLTGLVLNLHGHAVILSERLGREGLREGASLREAAGARAGEPRLTFAVDFALSSPHLFLRSWLAESGLDPDRDAQVVTTPAVQMPRLLAAGAIDGFCAGEPWGTQAVRAGAGWCPAWSSAAGPLRPDKVLLVTESFAARRPAEHAALIAALAEACAWCDQPENRDELAGQLAGAVPSLAAELLRPSLAGRFDCGHGRIEAIPDFHVFHRGEANVPAAARAEELQAELQAAGLLRPAELDPGLPAQLFREDLFRSARPALAAS
jgi:ABC-type nitrate/sulfonate/bicarbonate transport system substrate-binding protein